MLRVTFLIKFADVAGCVFNKIYNRVGNYVGLVALFAESDGECADGDV